MLSLTHFVCLFLWTTASNLITINKPLFDPETNDDIVNATTLVPITTIDSNHKYIERPITIAENSTAFLKCVPEENEFRNVSQWITALRHANEFNSLRLLITFDKAEWLVENTSRRLINSISTDGSTVSVLTILDVTKNDTGSYSCRKSPKVIERFHLNVHGEFIRSASIRIVLDSFYQLCAPDFLLSKTDGLFLSIVRTFRVMSSWMFLI